jgi:hypothetical protein
MQAAKFVGGDEPAVHEGSETADASVDLQAYDLLAGR